MAKIWYKFWAKLFFLFFVFCIGMICGSTNPFRLVAGKDGGLDLVKMPNTDESKNCKPKKIKKHNKIGFQSEENEPS